MKHVHIASGCWWCETCGRVDGSDLRTLSSDEHVHGKENHRVRRVQPWEPCPDEQKREATA
jgi:hypothetical protein